MHVTVPSLAKLNLDLRVLHKREDGYHELRTIFQTISLSDSLAIDFAPAKRTRIEIDSSVEIADNLVLRAADRLLGHLKIHACVRFRLLKRIPLGAGLGGGSSNAAAVLVALPALAGRPIPVGELVRLGETLGADVPFFLLGGTALALGRGTELYPLPDQPARWAVVVTSGIHVSTPEAYRSLGRDVTNALTSKDESPILREFQTVAWSLADCNPRGSRPDRRSLKNDFEGPVFGLHPELKRQVRKLQKTGAMTALMTGSGSAVFGIFQNRSSALAAAAGFPDEKAFLVRFVSRRQYRSRWRRALGDAANLSCFSQS